MNTAEKQLFVKKLGTDSDEELAKTLNYYRSNADLDMLPHILELLASDRSDAAKDCILQLCNDVRDIDAANIVFDFMAQTRDVVIKRKLMQALWSTGVDFSHKAEHIVGIITSTDDFEMAFEALSLLENSTESLSPTLASSLHDTITAAGQSAPEIILSLNKAAKDYLLVKIHNA
jgi:hypothetical protein